MSQQLNLSRRPLNITPNFLCNLLTVETGLQMQIPRLIFQVLSLHRAFLEPAALPVCVTLTVNQLTCSRFHGSSCASSVSNPNYESWVSSDFLQVVSPKVLFRLK